MLSKNFSSIFSVGNETFMKCSSEYNCTENEKTELIHYFILPAERLHTPAGSFLL